MSWDITPGLYNSEARNASRDGGATNMGLKQKRPDRVGAQFSTRVLYHNGMRARLRLGTKEKKSKTRTLKNGRERHPAKNQPAQCIRDAWQMLPSP